ncbi:hypothetical protein LCGC14_1425000 [marine sediment metagenome]|uniref:Uncharacterized protein n=1 Tax=marine sediment metagenome TaxID=412755 RepID=A0A0F9M5R5_9ZZZZ
MNQHRGTLADCKGKARDRHRDGCRVKLERMLKVPFNLRSLRNGDTFRISWDHPDMVGSGPYESDQNHFGITYYIN